MQVSTEEYEAVMAEEGVPVEFRTFLNYLFGVLGHNAYVTDGIQRALDASPGFLGVRTGRRRIRSVERVGGDRLRRRSNASRHIARISRVVVRDV